MTAYPCSRCAGTGRLNVFSHVLGGTCFKCNGTGTQRHKPAAPSVKWAVFGHGSASGDSRRLFNVTAKSEAEAILKARKAYDGASVLFKEENTLETAQAIKFSDMADPSALTWEYATTKKEAA